MTALGAISLGILGLLAGLLIGAIGIGGVVVVPALVYFGGIPIHVAIAAAMMSYVFTGLIGTLVYTSKSSVRWSMAWWLCGGAMPAALAGALAADRAPSLLLEILIGLLTAAAGIQALPARAHGCAHIRHARASLRERAAADGATRLLPALSLHSALGPPGARRGCVRDDEPFEGARRGRFTSRDSESCTNSSLRAVTCPAAIRPCAASLRGVQGLPPHGARSSELPPMGSFECSTHRSSIGARQWPCERR